MPAMLPFYPTYAANILQYRYNSLDETHKIAKIFGYNGSMFAWTAYVFKAFVYQIIESAFPSRAYFGRAQVGQNTSSVLLMMSIVGLLRWERWLGRLHRTAYHW